MYVKGALSTISSTSNNTVCMQKKQVIAKRLRPLCHPLDLPLFIGVQTYWKGKNYKHVREMSDNITAVSYVNNKRGIKSEFCNEIAKEL